MKYSYLPETTLARYNLKKMGYVYEVNTSLWTILSRVENPQDYKDFMKYAMFEDVSELYLYTFNLNNKMIDYIEIQSIIWNKNVTCSITLKEPIMFWYWHTISRTYNTMKQAKDAILKLAFRFNNNTSIRDNYLLHQ